MIILMCLKQLTRDSEKYALSQRKKIPVVFSLCRLCWTINTQGKLAAFKLCSSLIEHSSFPSGLRSWSIELRNVLLAVQSIILVTGTRKSSMKRTGFYLHVTWRYKDHRTNVTFFSAVMNFCSWVGSLVNKYITLHRSLSLSHINLWILIRSVDHLLLDSFLYIMSTFLLQSSCNILSPFLHSFPSRSRVRWVLPHSTTIWTRMACIIMLHVILFIFLFVSFSKKREEQKC